MTFGSRVAAIRKEKQLSQSELGKRAGISGDIVGKYERGDAMPSIDIAKRMADAFETSLDYLVGNAEEKLDKATLDRVLEINKLQPKEKEMVFTFLDTFLTKTKLQGLL